jgi:hypothetical protein
MLQRINTKMVLAIDHQPLLMFLELGAISKPGAE